MVAETEKQTHYIVSPYLVDRVYGGPEEGGWYYEAGEPLAFGELDGVPAAVIATTEAQAIEARDAMQQTLDETYNKHRPRIDSIVSQGVYRAVIDENHWPRPYPSETPHYE